MFVADCCGVVTPQQSETNISEFKLFFLLTTVFETPGCALVFPSVPDKCLCLDDKSFILVNLGEEVSIPTMIFLTGCELESSESRLTPALVSELFSLEEFNMVTDDALLLGLVLSESESKETAAG